MFRWKPPTLVRPKTTQVLAWLYASLLILIGLVLLALAPLSRTLFTRERLEEQAVAAIAAGRLLEPVRAMLWIFGAVVLVGGVRWLLGSWRWTALVSLALGAAAMAGAVAASDQLAPRVPTIRPAMTLTLSANDSRLPELRRLLYAYAQGEGLGYADNSPAMALRQHRPDALWVELNKDETTVAIASDLLHPGQVSIQFYDAPTQKRSETWKERLYVQLAPAWPQIKLLP
jgi:hypothetical protein